MDENNKTKKTPKIKPKSKMGLLMEELDIDETYTKPLRKYKFDTVKQNTYPEQNYNYMIDTMVLPKTKEGYKHLLTMVDLWSNECDFEPLKSLTAEETLEAFKKIVKRPYLKLPEASIRSDNGVEFKGNFAKFLKNNNILQRVALPYRHKQLANVESLNNTLSRILMTYLTNKELKTQKPYHEWTDILPTVRIKLNEIRKRENGDPYSLEHLPYTQKEPKFNIGDVVIRKSEYPINALGHMEDTMNFRNGDIRYDIQNKLKIIKVLNYPNNIRYILNGFPNVSYAEAELMGTNTNEEYHKIKAIINHKVYKGQSQYLIWWKGELKAQATWEPASQLIEDGLKEEILNYHKDLKKKKK